MSPCAPKRTLPLVGAVLTAKKTQRHVRGRDRSHNTGDLFLKPCLIACRAHRPAGADMSPCAPNRTPPLVEAVLTAKKTHRHVRGRDRSHNAGDLLKPCSIACRAHQPAGADMNPCAQNRTPPLVGAVLTAKRIHGHVRGRDRSHGTGDRFLEPCAMPCRARRPAGAHINPCTQKRTPPLVGAVLAAKKTHRHVRGRDRSHNAADLLNPVQSHVGLTSQRVPT